MNSHSPAAKPVTTPRRFSDFYRDGARPAISFELFPPKTDAAMANLNALMPELIELQPAFMTVTYGALGTTRERTLEIASHLRRTYGIDVACHLTCVGSSRSDLDVILGEIHDAGIRNIVALRGDPPQGEKEFVPPADGFRHANELVAHIRKFESARQDEFGIAVAGYPEKHIEAPDFSTDLANLKRKVDSGADCVITQLFYNNADYYNFVERAREAGINVPIVPGLLPIVSLKQIRRIASMCGATVPGELMRELEACGEDEAACEEIGVRQCVAQARDLLKNGAPGIHFYVLNRSSHISQIMREIRS